MIFNRASDRTRSTHRAPISAIDRLKYFLRSRASKVVVLALVGNMRLSLRC